MSCSRSSIINIAYDCPGFILISRCCHLKERRFSRADLFSNSLEDLALNTPIELRPDHMHQCQFNCGFIEPITDVVIAAIAKCNLSCFHCCAGQSGSISGWNAKNISKEELQDRKNFLFDALSYLRTKKLSSISMDGSGEIFIYYDDLVKVLKSFSGENTKIIYFQTNATLLNKNKIINLLKISKMTGVQYRFAISIDGISEKTFSACRSGANFNEVLDNLKLISKVFPCTTVIFTVKRPNVEDVPFVEKFFEPYGVNITWNSDYFDEEYCSKFVPVEKRYS